MSRAKLGVLVSPPQNLIEPTDGERSIVIIFIVICVVEVFIIMVATLVYWKYKVIRASQRQFLLGMELSGIVALGGSVVLTETTNLACGLRPFVVTLPMTFLFSCLFAKTWRLWKLTSNKKMKKMIITNTKTFGIAVGLWLPVALIFFITAYCKSERTD